jgi:hypothetical protein
MSLKKAIEKMCRECGGSDSALPGTWRMKVLACDFCGCPLHIYRPKPLKRLKRIKNEQKKSN